MLTQIHHNQLTKATHPDQSCPDVIKACIQTTLVVARIAGQIVSLLAGQPVFWMFAAAVGFMAGMGTCFAALT